MSQTTRRSLLKTLGVGGTVFAFGAGAGYAQTDSGSSSEDGASEGVSFPPSEDTALLRALHASPDAPAVDVYVDGEQVAQGVEFGSITGYLELSPGEVEVQVYPSEAGGEGTTGTGNETTTESEGLGNETTTESGAAVENETGTESEGLGNETTTEGGMNATNETGAGAENETTTEGGMNATNETTTEAGAGGSGGQTPSGDPVIDESVTVQGGNSYTVAAINQLDDIEALVLEDEPEDDQTQDEEANTAMVRSVHLSPDAPTVKVRVDSHVVGSALEYEEASDYADVQTGTSKVEVLPTGSADPVSTANYEFEAGKRYNLFLVGMVDPEAAAAQGGLGTDSGNQTTTETEGLGNQTTETELGTGNETTTEAGGMNATNETGAGAENETGGMNATNETTTEAGGMNATNETTTEAGAGGSEGQTPESFRILAVQDGTGSVLEEAEEEGTPSADDLLPVDLSDDNESAGNATTGNETTANGTTENETVGNATAENETTANGTAANGTVTEANNTTTSD